MSQVFEIRAKWSDDPEWGGMVYCYVMDGEKVLHERFFRPGELDKEVIHDNCVVHGGDVTVELTAWAGDCRKQLGVKT